MRTLNNRISSQVISLVAGLAVVAATAACTTTQSPGQQTSDAAIAAKVKAKLAADPEVNPFEIDVDADNGVIRLSGMVEEPFDRAEAERLARATSGVVDVVNDIEIGDQTAGEVLDDAVIASKIKAKITGDAEVNPLNVDVDVIQGKVTLTGRVRTERAQERAGELARMTKGVTSVDNRIEVVG